VKSCGVAGEMELPFARVKDGASDVTSVPGLTGSFTVDAPSSMIASAFSSGRATPPIDVVRPASSRISEADSAVS
jgi:hypothetical protein